MAAVMVASAVIGREEELASMEAFLAGSCTVHGSPCCPPRQASARRFSRKPGWPDGPGRIRRAGEPARPAPELPLQAHRDTRAQV